MGMVPSFKKGHLLAKKGTSPGRDVQRSSRALDNVSTEEYVTSSVLGQGVFDSPSLTLVIGATIF
jgi:hypothetical protein